MANRHSAKPKREMITLETKYNAIRQVDAGRSMSDVAENMGMPRRYISTWMQQRDKLEKWSTKTIAAKQRNDRMLKRPSRNQQLNESVFLWFNQHRLRGTQIVGPMIQMQALKFHRIMGGGDSFKASNGWLDKWKNRYGIRQLAMGGDKLDNASVKEFTEGLLRLIEEKELTPEQVFNCDETGLNYKMIPSKSMGSATEGSGTGNRENKERVTVLACSNVSGALKIPLMVVGKSAEPIAVKRQLSVFYRYQKNAWMDSSLFKEWFQTEFVPRVTEFCTRRGLTRKVLLIIDNAPSHPLPEDFTSGDITIEFFPPNVASVIQPMDQGVLENLKRHYRQHLASYLMNSIDNGGDTRSYLEAVGMKEVIQWVAKAWEEVTPASIQKSWWKAWPGVSFSQPVQAESDEDTKESSSSAFFNNTDHIEYCESADKGDTQEGMKRDDAAAPISPDAEMIELITNDNESEESHEDRSPRQSAQEKAKDGLDYALAFFENLPGYSPGDLAVLCRARDIAALHCERIDRN